MNIHFTDKKLFDDLKESTLVKIKVGSHMYGLENGSSDIDYLMIYVNGRENLRSFVNTHHQLQYKDTVNNIDYIFTSLQQFIENIITGESTINFEVLHSKEIEESELSFLFDLRKSFYNYTVIKSYLGMAKRDYKILNKRYNGKKTSHFIRGVLFAQEILEYNLDSESADLRNTWDSNRDLLKSVKESVNKDDFLVKINLYESKMNAIRSKSNILLDGGLINKFMSGENMKKLDEKVRSFCKSEFYLSREKDFLDFGDMFYRTYRTDVDYTHLNKG